MHYFSSFRLSKNVFFCRRKNRRKENWWKNFAWCRFLIPDQGDQMSLWKKSPEKWPDPFSAKFNRLHLFREQNCPNFGVFFCNFQKLAQSSHPVPDQKNSFTNDALSLFKSPWALALNVKVMLALVEEIFQLLHSICFSWSFAQRGENHLRLKRYFWAHYIIVSSQSFRKKTKKTNKGIYLSFTYLSIYLSIYLYISIYLCLYLCTYRYLYISRYLSICIHIYLYIYISIYISIYMHTYIHLSTGLSLVLQNLDLSTCTWKHIQRKSLSNF
jgi:hypothetical protein